MHNFFGILKQSISLSWTNIKSNKMRTFLTTLGIIIGVTAVIALITIVNGAIDYMMGEFSNLGAGTINVYAYGTPLKYGLTEKDVEEFYDINNISGFTPKIKSNTAASYRGDSAKNVSILGISQDYYKNNPTLVTSGRAISKTDCDNKAYVCVINQDLVNKFFRGENPINKNIYLCGVEFTIIGVEGKNDDLMAQMATASSTQELDGKATIPYTTAKKITRTDRINELEVYVLNTDYTDALIDDIETMLYNSFNQKDDCYTVFSMDSLLDTMNKMMRTMSYMLAGIASIALLVGGIGIMNMMLVSVTERTKEIGLRKAMGATPKRIQLQFLLESITLSLMGGFLGIILGILLSIIVETAIDVPFSLNIGAILLGVGFSTIVGIIFGWAPAKKASQLSPIDALRSE